MSSGDIPPNDDPTPEEVLEALREAISNNPRLDDMPASSSLSILKRFASRFLCRV